MVTDGSNICKVEVTSQGGAVDKFEFIFSEALQDLWLVPQNCERHVEIVEQQNKQLVFKIAGIKFSFVMDPTAAISIQNQDNELKPQHCKVKIKLRGNCNIEISNLDVSALNIDGAAKLIFKHNLLLQELNLVRVNSVINNHFLEIKQANLDITCFNNSGRICILELIQLKVKDFINKNGNFYVNNRLDFKVNNLNNQQGDLSGIDGTLITILDNFS